MLPNPLHPAVVHFPIVFVVILPIFAAGALWAIRRGTLPRRAWSIPLLIAGALAISAFVATRTGEAGEEKVEDVVSETALHTHEEAAERFLVLSGVLLVIAGFGLLRNNLGSAARLVTTVGSLGVLAAGIQVGAAGGELVYKHNAASVYSTNVAAGEQEAAEHDDD
jgi:uncharacterized membrane protein